MAGAFVIVAGLMTFKVLNDRRKVLNGPGRLDGASLVSLADGRRVLVVTSGSELRDMHNSLAQDRIELIDPSDGHFLARVPVDKPTFCVEAAPGLLWCDTNLGGESDLHLRDTATLAVHAPHDRVVAQAPPLSSGAKGLVDPRTGEAWLLTSTGTYWHVDPRTLKGSAEGEQPRGLDRIGPFSSDDLALGFNDRSPGKQTLEAYQNSIGQGEVAATWFVDGRTLLGVRSAGHGGQGEVIALDADGRVLWRTGT